MAQTRTPRVAKKAATKKTAAPKKRVIVKTATGQIEDDPNLHAYVPDKRIAQAYVPRKVWGVWDHTIAGNAMREGDNIALAGDTGSGKTMFGEAFAARWGMLYYSLPCDVSIDPSYIFGRMVATETKGVFRWQDGPATQIFRHGGVWNISEGNFMSPKIAASTYSALDGRRYISLLGHEGEIIRAHLGTKGRKPCWCKLSPAECNRKRVLIIIDYNPMYRGTMMMNEAFLNRFQYKVPWGYDPTVEEKLIKFPTLRDVADKLRDSSDVLTPVSTNMLMEFERFTMDKTLGLNFAIENFVAAFSKDEQVPIKKAIELAETNLKKDVLHFRQQSALKKSDDDETELEEIEFEMEEEA